MAAPSNFFEELAETSAKAIFDRENAEQFERRQFKFQLDTMWNNMKPNLREHHKTFGVDYNIVHFHMKALNFKHFTPTLEEFVENLPAELVTMIANKQAEAYTGYVPQDERPHPVYNVKIELGAEMKKRLERMRRERDAGADADAPGAKKKVKSEVKSEPK